ncbi:MAG: hypothetical protein EZS28_028325 [Streblomastix strix]|uniref:SPRY domain-containing protein n=1 Tax=Streblomastix strix TaxID=222440 RepID=A0A5J4V0M1_9EUKA|nr:MAG: hypothetical protein EZS28_028325 [Streblomastix strix]
MSDGIWSMEAKFQNKQNQEAIGIVKASNNIITGQCPCCHEGQDIVIYGEGCGDIDCLAHNNNRQLGNTKYGDNQLVRAELDFDKGTLTFFLDNVQQPLYISWIKEKVSFLVSMYRSGASCTIKSLRKLSQPTVGQVNNMRAIQW